MKNIAKFVVDMFRLPKEMAVSFLPKQHFIEFLF